MVLVSTLGRPVGNVWYLAYGSNLSSSKFVRDRGIRPLAAVLVAVPGFTLAMESAGVPYREPSSEGGGIAYKEINVRVIPLKISAKSESKSLYEVSNEDLIEARTLNLVVNGAIESSYPPDYQLYLKGIRTYQPATHPRARLGAELFLSLWIPIMTMAEKITKISIVWFGDEYGNAPYAIILLIRAVCPHIISCIDTRDEWFYGVHPERTVPALKDQDLETGETFTVFEGTACLQYLASKFDKDGLWTGKTEAEKGKVMSWTAYQTAGIGPTAKYWLYFLRGYPTRNDPVQLPRTIEKLHSNVLRQWDILENRLSEVEQKYVALKDRPTIADLSYLPFAMPWMFDFFHVSIDKWPQIALWSKRMMARPAVKYVLDVAPRYGN
ncbi:hypothetical protein GQX73_g508 [Xylaria multiplex]|uniref:glutathione transferase n=1 Tax=Xylaria multiplex TaxID=323545 RepID=A0A7C8N0X8_9PEZI|nr:hypothetical protein GQX73_g508 [Xylaria multiplex]